MCYQHGAFIAHRLITIFKQFLLTLTDEYSFYISVIIFNIFKISLAVYQRARSGMSLYKFSASGFLSAPDGPTFSPLTIFLTATST